jgi:cysteine desulfurase/selenocysteine lyase
MNTQAIRHEFPLLGRKMNDKPLVYLDNAATTQKPLRVIERINEFYRDEYATVHRGVYALSQDSTIECEEVRERAKRFINANRKEEIIFVKGATEAINLVASSLGAVHFKPGDEILISEVEHHANIVPWQFLAQQKNLKLKAIPVTDAGELDMAAFKKNLTSRVRLLAIAHVSNVLGTVFPIKELSAMAHAAGALVLVDGAQGAPHLKVDVQDLGCDFYCFSGHKLYGPTGIGILYGKYDLLNKMPPYQLGGDMIESVTFEKTTYSQVPAKFEAGTPAIAQIVGLGAALAYLEGLGLGDIETYETQLLNYATAELSKIQGLKIYGEAKRKASLISFTLGEIHPHDLGTILDQEGIAIRAGHHCSQPTMRRFGIPATARASFAFYNTKEEVDALVQAVRKAKDIFK